MDKSNLELFKQAISDGLSKKFDSVVNSYTDEIVCSEQHNFAMRTMVYGKAVAKRTWSPKKRRIIAILVAAALLLTSCAVIFRNEIREVVDEFFAKYVYSGDRTDTDAIEEVYELTYLPEGYGLKEKRIAPMCTQFKYIDESDNFIIFEQRILDKSDFTVDSESGCSKIIEIEKYDIYYRKNSEQNVYVWTDSKCSLWLNASIELSYEEIIKIIDGITIK